MIGRLIDFLEDLFLNLTGKGKTAVISTIPQKEFKAFKKNSALAAREARKGFQPDVWGM